MEKQNINKDKFAQGLDLLRQPILPLVSMVEFFLMTGDFSTVEQVVGELPAPIETGYACYPNPGDHLASYTQVMQDGFEASRAEQLDYRVFTHDGHEVDNATAAMAMMQQRILTFELERINSVLCAPCNCRLCCIGPDSSMRQKFFEIPLAAEELPLFSAEKLDTAETRAFRSMDDNCLKLENRPFFERSTAACVHWTDGWSLILPENVNCPNLEQKNGRCQVYADRPQVCRRPQIFPYILEPIGDGLTADPSYRLRRTILAVMDCPYVSLLQEELAQYAAACELELIFSRNKE